MFRNTLFVLSKYVRLEVKGPVAEVILCRPNKLNTMDDGFFNDLRQCMEEADQDLNLRAIILWAEGRMFTAGLDLKTAGESLLQESSILQRAKVATSMALHKTLGTTPVGPTETGMPAMRNQKLYQLVRRWQDAVSSIQKCRLPVIAAVHNKCLGGGVDVISAADIRLCTSDSIFAIQEAQVAITADLGTLQRISSIVGGGIAREWALTTLPFDAERAKGTGFVNHVYSSQEEMLENARKMASKIASISPIAVQGTKTLLNYSMDHTVDDSLKFGALWSAAFLKSDDVVKAVASFLTKTKADYQDIVLPPSPLPTVEGKDNQGKK